MVKPKTNAEIQKYLDKRWVKDSHSTFLKNYGRFEIYALENNFIGVKGKIQNVQTIYREDDERGKQGVTVLLEYGNKKHKLHYNFQTKCNLRRIKNISNLLKEFEMFDLIDLNGMEVVVITSSYIDDHSDVEPEGIVSLNANFDEIYLYNFLSHPKPHPM